MVFWFSQQVLALHSALPKQISSARKSSFVLSETGLSTVVCTKSHYQYREAIKEQDRRSQCVHLKSGER